MTATGLMDVLIVDDSAAIRKILQRVLRQTDLPLGEIKEAGDGTEAVEILKDRSFGLILSDINMPGMSGLEMLPRARQMRPDVPVIMITAYGDPETRRKAIENGASGLLTKPIDFALLRNEIDMRLGQAA